jgi:NAD(P)-dependent dehydrogenase (short-subunit alcohol dehydrogenase family)
MGVTQPSGGFMFCDLTGRTALVTGAGSEHGIGFASARLLASCGAEVVLTATSERVHDRAAELGHGARGVIADLTDADDVERLVRTCGEIDVLVNNAGIYEAVSDNAPDEEWHAAWARTMTINLQAAADLSRLAVSHFLDRGGGGRIINITSRAAFRGDSPQHWHYAASKAAMVGMIRTIARGYAGDGILCFGVAPGFTVSEMTAEYLEGRGGAGIVADIPLGRVASTDEVAEVIRWLATEAPASATGSIIDVNGASYVR